jgi:diguanylate cyclase
MKSLQVLSQTIIETLREFSSTRSPLSADTLFAALSNRREIIEILKDSPEIVKGEQIEDFSKKKIGRVPLRTPRPAGLSDLSQILRQVLDTFDSILATIEPIAREENVQRSLQLRHRLHNCETAESIFLESGELVAMVSSVVSRAAEQIDFANDFLAELSQSLSAMEKQLFSYQSHNRETYILHDQFCDDLLSQTREMDQAIVASKAIKDARDVISSRLSIIEKAIETKRQEDEARLKQADSKIAELQISVRNYNEEIDKVTQHAKELEKEVLLDPLLQINNRRFYDLKIQESIKAYQRTGQSFSVILIDADHFKDINDQFGHRAGDKCLIEVAKLAAGCVRKTDFLARYGGEELVVIVPGANAEETRKIAEKIRDCIDRTRFYYQDRVIRLTVSLGVTEAQPADTDAEKLFVRVDEAMYIAKKEGRNKVSVV